MMFCAVEQGFGRVVRLSRGGERGHGQQGDLARVHHAARQGGRRGCRLRGAAGSLLLADDDDVRRGHGWFELITGEQRSGKGTKGVNSRRPTEREQESGQPQKLARLARESEATFLIARTFAAARVVGRVKKRKKDGGERGGVRRRVMSEKEGGIRPVVQFRGGHRVGCPLLDSRIKKEKRGVLTSLFPSSLRHILAPTGACLSCPPRKY
jgi:hypothetical protein